MMHRSLRMVNVPSFVVVNLQMIKRTRYRINKRKDGKYS